MSMAKVKVRLWKVVGYAGFHDYDGPEDYNINRVVPMPIDIDKESVEKFVASKYKTRVVALSARHQGVVEVEGFE